MQPFFIIFCFSLFLTVQSLVIEQRSCVSPDVITIAQQVSHPHYFCAWYLSDGRTRSPIPGINTDALLNACRCVVSVEPVGTNAKTLAAIAKTARLHSYVSATCPRTPGNPISKEFKNPPSFCTFFRSYERHDSPIPNLNVPAVRHACKCVLNGLESSSTTSSTRKALSHSAERTTSKNPSTNKSNSKTSSIVISRSSSRSTVHRTSSKTSSNKLPLSIQTPLTRASTKSSSTKTSSRKTLSTDKASSSKMTSMTKSPSRISLKESSSTEPSSIRISSSKTSTSKLSSSKVVPSTNLPSSQTPSSRMTWFTTSSISVTASSIFSSNTSLKSSAFTRSVSLSSMSTSGVTYTSSGSSMPSRSPISSSTSTPGSIARPTPIANPYAPCGNQPYGSVFANQTGQYKLYCNSYDIEGFEMYDYWIGMWGSIRQCDARVACTGVKCHGDYCMLYFGPLTLVPASSGSVALRIMPDAYEMITSNDLEAFCTTYLGYTTPSITETTTFFANATNTAVFNLTATSKIAALTTKTDFVETITVTSTISASIVPVPFKKRAPETPMELDYYPENEISSGCSRAATQPMTTTVLESVIITSTESVATTTTAVAYINITSTITELATSTTTVFIDATSPTLSSAICTPIPKIDAEQQAKDSIALDFLFSHNNLASMFSSFPMSVLNESTITGDVLPSIQSALQNWVPCTAISHNVTEKLLACKDYTTSISFATCIVFRTDPDSIRVWKNVPAVPTFALIKARTDYRNINVGIDGVQITLNMSLIEVMDHATQGGYRQAREFKTMQYYFGEPGGHLY